MATTVAERNEELIGERTALRELHCGPGPLWRWVASGRLTVMRLKDGARERRLFKRAEIERLRRERTDSADSKSEVAQ